MKEPCPTSLLSVDRPSQTLPRTITGRQIREARALLCWTRSEFSRLTALPVRVLDRAEAIDGEPSITRGQLIAIRHALARAGVEFASDPPGVRLRTADPA